MEYSKHYNRMSMSKGVPALNSEQQRRMLNIISLESRLEELENLEKVLGRNRSLWTRMESIKKQLVSLTHHEAPSTILEEMIRKSRY